jgi:photosystem II stability/assembly factor-like uncharacterized protein
MKPLVLPHHALALVLAFVLITPSFVSAQPLIEGRRERKERIIDHYWTEHSPERYLAALAHAARMPDGDRSEKGARLMRSTRWEAIGPIAARVSPNRNWHGRMRSIRWYRNPVTGRTETILGASSGGLWIANLAGLVRVWTPLGDNLQNPAVGAFLVDSLDPNTIWVGTGDWARYGGAGLFRTTDRGATWQRAILGDGDVLPRAITGIEYGPSRSIIYLSSSSGVFRTTDGGERWTRTGAGGARPIVAFSMVVDPSDRRIVYAAQGDFDGGIAKSTDAGSSWTDVNEGIDLGRTSLPIALAISPSSPNILYAAAPSRTGNTGSVYRTTNRGGRWDSTGTLPEYLHSNQAGNNHAIVVDPTNPNRVFLGGVGLIRSTDGGATWVFRQDGHTDITGLAFQPGGDPNVLTILNDGGIFALDDARDSAGNGLDAFSPCAPIQAYSFEDAWSNSSVMLSGTQDNGTMVTDQAGQTDRLWWLAGGCDGANTAAIHPENPSLFYFNSLCGPSYRLRSDDMGRTQVHINNGLATVYYVPLVMNKGNTNYIFTITPTHLYYSSDRGTTWLRVTSGPGVDFDTMRTTPKGLRVNFNGTGDVVAYVWQGGFSSDVINVFRGVPGRDTIRRTVTSLPGREIVGRVAVDRWNPRGAYAMTTGRTLKLYRTTDEGRTWTDITGNLPEVPTNDIVASPTDARVMWAATDIGMFVTRDGGATWARYQQGLPIVGVQALAYIRGDAFDTLRIATFGRGHWQRVVDGGDPLARLIDGTRLGGVVLRDVIVHAPAATLQLPDTLVGVGRAGLIARSHDDARSFRFEALPGGLTLRAISASSPSVITAVGDDGTIVHSRDGGAQWQVLSSGVLIALRAIAFSSSQGVIAGDDGAILHSTDGGGSWTRVHDQKGVSWRAISFVDEQNAWVTGSGFLSRTTDGGATWIGWQTPPAAFTSLAMTDAGVGFATAGGGILYLTTDGGSSWQPRQSPVQSTLTDLVALDDETVYVTTDDGRVLVTTDRGKGWSVVDDVQTTGAFHAIARGRNNLYAVGDSAVAVIRFGPEPPPDTIGKPPFIEVFPASIKSKAGAVRVTSVAPNPTTAGVTIGFALERAGAVTISIHSLLGETIARLDDRAASPGAQEARWDGLDAAGRPVPSGAYLVRIASRGAVVTARVSVLR